MRTVRASLFPKLLAAASFALFAIPSSAAIVDAPDHTYLTDTATGLDWLDVTTTAGMSFNQVSSQLGTGGQFAGWRYASGDEFNTLVSNYSGIGIPAGYHGQTNMEPDLIDGLVTLLGSTLDTYWLATYGVTWDRYSGFAEGQGIDFTYGILADIFPNRTDYHHLAIIYDSDVMPNANDFSYGKDYSATFPNHSNLQFGSFLVRDHIAAPVPEPETYAMMFAGLGLLGLMTRRRKQKLNA